MTYKIKPGDKVKQRNDLVTIYGGPNGAAHSNSEYIYTVREVFRSSMTGELNLLADDGRHFTGGPCGHFKRL